MKVILQRVNRASVKIDDNLISSINKGYLLLVGVLDTDGLEEIEYLANKISKTRIFEDENSKMNLDIQSVNGKILSVSQFTLFADTKKGNRPSFAKAGEPEHAKLIYDQFNQALRDRGIDVKTGQFGADMQISLENDGPVTLIYDTDQK
ncbi:D-aminoacyl-tRNA deacylase [Lentilactobacillus laojiaonis]|uniref:D-aminoacyl-tRNA deacylase n=1 Tax=Lentilactobacillus laojiaonis TaxID=2883998 RepID=UPI001D0BC587|nr:D-aminoacyl-tRNA deacylase [Lentilactobacillus laojiaonis]UDM31637.1 D-tyrosyl-tRNA(Tyr) deacylase [Lentilactobacillus laojiaonis]